MSYLENGNITRKTKLLKGTVLASTLIFTLGFSGCSLIPKEKAVQAPALIAPANVKYEIKKVERGTIVKKFKDTGTLKASREQEAYFDYYKGGKLKALYVQSGDTVKKGQVLAEIDTEGLEGRIREQEIMYEKSKLMYDHIKEKGADAYELKQSELDLELQKIRLDEVRGEAKKAKIFAAFSGKVVNVSAPKIGDFVESLKPILTVAEGSGLKVRYKVFADSEFHLGMKAKVEYKGITYEGEAVAVPSEKGADLELSVKNLPKDAKFGERVIFELEVASKEKVLKVPINAVHEYEDQVYVERLENGMRVEKYVKIGIKTNDEVEIVEGLSEGEEIIVE